MVKDADLQEIVYDKNTQNLMMVMRFNSELTRQTFKIQNVRVENVKIENVTPNIYRNLR